MRHNVTIGQDIVVKISRIVQISAPDLFSQCRNDEDIRRTALSFSGLVSKEYNLNDIYTIIPTNQPRKDTVAHLATVYTQYPSITSRQYSYHLDILWFQDDFSMNISPEVLDKLRMIPFEDIARIETLPF